MNTRIKNLIKYVRENYTKYEYITLIIVVIIIVNFGLMAGKGYLDYRNIISSIIILIVYLGYKGILSRCIKGYVLYNPTTSFGNLKFVGLHENILKERKGLIKGIYYGLYYFPTNWLYLIVLGVARKGWDIRIYINSNKDVIGKKYLKKNGSYMKMSDKNLYMGYKKYIHEVIFRILYLSLYIKLNIIGKGGDLFIVGRLFGIIYATVLIENNLHILTGFKNTEIILLGQKVIIVLILIYIFLYNMLGILDRKRDIVNKDFNDYFKKILKTKVDKDVKKGNSEVLISRSVGAILVEKQRIKFNKLIWSEMYEHIEELTISRYYFMKEYLIFMSLADMFADKIDDGYYGFIRKNYNKSNINLVSNYVKFGIYNNANYLDNQHYYNTYRNLCNDVNYEGKYIDTYGIFEKNYKISFFLNNSFYLLIDKFEKDYLDSKINYELLKIFYGEEIIEKYCKEEIEEFESIFFINKLYSIVFAEQKSEIVKTIQKKEHDDIPNKIMNNKKYNEILELSNFLLEVKTKPIQCLQYKYFLQGNSLLYVNLIIENFYKIYDKYEDNIVKEVIIYFYNRDMKASLSPEAKLKLLMGYKIYDMGKHIKEVSNKINNIIQNKDKESLLKLIKELQEEHKKKYFVKEPFFMKYDELGGKPFKKEGEFFDKKE